MPKERLHILIAEKSLGVLESRGVFSALQKEVKTAYLFGAIFPDALFYDLPSFGLSPLGNAMHKLEGEDARARILGEWLAEPGARQDMEWKAWVLGLIVHFIADGFWHPHIDKISDQTGQLCHSLGLLSPRNCHYWLESELEAYWINLLGPTDGYLPLLKGFQGSELRKRHVDSFRTLLSRCGFREIPSAARINRCLLWQSFLLRQFATSWWAGRRRRLLAAAKTRYIGALIVPARPALPALAASSGPTLSREERGIISELLAGNFMAKTIMLSATHLSALATRF